MAIEGYSREEVGKRIAELVTPSQPVNSIEHLKGRESELQDVERALAAKGRNVFIYGDRGVARVRWQRPPRICTRARTQTGVRGRGA